ncbi:MAG: DNA topoisomerase, partial [Lentisphaeria bacterium]
MAFLGVFVLSCTTLSGNSLQLENPRRVAAASTRRARASFGDMSTFKEALAPFKASLNKWNNKKAKISDKATADKILAHIKENDYQLSKIKESSRKIQPGPSYITSTLQQDAARFMGFSAKRTMMVAQQLYEGIE